MGSIYASPFAIRRRWRKKVADEWGEFRTGLWLEVMRKEMLIWQSDGTLLIEQITDPTQYEFASDSGEPVDISFEFCVSALHVFCGNSEFQKRRGEYEKALTSSG